MKTYLIKVHKEALSLKTLEFKSDLSSGSD